MSTPSYDVSVRIQIATGANVPEERLIEAVIDVLTSHQTSGGTGVTIVLVDDNEITALNRQFRDVDSPTDVLSFPADPVPVPGEEPYLGDLILALPFITRQAETEGHSLSDELVLAVIHGTLHLLGYDHDTAAHQAAMWAAQRKALQSMSVNIQVPEFEFPDEESD